jgi:hypothetical protein
LRKLEEDDILLSSLAWCKFKERVNFEATFNDYMAVNCDMIAAEYPTGAEIIPAIEGVQILIMKC